MQKKTGVIMTNLSKSFRCNSCGTDFPLSLNTDLELNDFTMLSKCPKCNNSMQIHFGVIKQETAVVKQIQAQLPNLDESIFASTEMPSNEIKKLIEG